MNNISDPAMKEVRGYVMIMMMRSDDAYTPITGCDATEIMNCLLLEGDAYDACIAACSGEEEEEVLPGYATVSAKAAAEQAVPYNTTNVKVGTITLKAGDNDTKVSSVEISRDGLYDSANSTLDVALRSANVETEYFTVSNTTDKAKVKFSPALELKAKESMTFDVVVDLSKNNAKNDTHNFKVTDVVVSNGTSAGYPVKLWTIKTTSAAAKTISIELESWDSPVKAGESQKKLAVVKVDFNSAAWVLNRITLWTTVTGTPTADLNELFDNLKAYVDDKEVWTVSITEEKVIISDLNVSKERYDTVKVELRGDVISTKNTNTATFDKTKVNVDASESTYGFGMNPSVPTNNVAVVVNWYNFVFKKATLENKNVIPGTNNVLVFDSTINSSTDVVIKKLDITTTATSALNSATDLKAWSARILINWEEYPLSEADAVAGVTNFATNVNVDAGKEARIQILFNTTDTAANHDIKYTVKLKEVKSVEKNAVAFDGGTVNWDQVKFQSAKATVAAATETAPATRSLFANKEQEIWRFSIKADGEKLTLKWFTLTVDSDLADDDITNYLDSNLTLVDVATDEEIKATFADYAWATDTIVISNITSYSIEKDKTANIKVMVNMPSIDAAHFGKHIKLVVKKDSINASANGKDITANDETSLSTENYTLRNTAPEITLSKAADNMFKVTIKNMDDNDAGIEFNDLVYRVRTTASDNKFEGKVCIVDDVNTITCPAWSQDFGKLATYIRMTDAVAAVPAVAWTPLDNAAVWAAGVAYYTRASNAAWAWYLNDGTYLYTFAGTWSAITAEAANKYYPLTNLGSAAVPATRNNVKLSKNAEKSLYILIDGDSIEPDVLKADVSSLSYDKADNDLTSPLTAEKYNVSKMLNE